MGAMNSPVSKVGVTRRLKKPRNLKKLPLQSIVFEYVQCSLNELAHLLRLMKLYFYLNCF